MNKGSLPQAPSHSHDLWRQSATTLAALIRSGEVSSREVIDAHLARIEAVNPALNAVTVMLCTSAREAADAADAQREMKGERDLPPAAVLPTRPIDNAPMAVQLYADRFRDDLVLEAAEVIEAAFGPCTPVDPFVA